MGTLLLSHLQKIPDPRRREGKRFELGHILLFTLLALISGADSTRAVARFMREKLDWFREHTGVNWPSAPSHTGLRRCLLKLDAQEMERALRADVQEDDCLAAGAALIAIDGKTLRGSADRFADKSALQWVSAFAAQEKLVLGQVELTDEDKGGEIQAAQELILSLGLSGKLFTLDALHCQKKHSTSSSRPAMMR